MYVKIRKDLLILSLGVLVGDEYYFDNEHLPYRWLDEDTMQVYFQEEWLETNSIDWDFIV